ncbi:hypothetical protein HanIR_Chr02g0089561 [Helianthus annuus]|nr:hypothetical protein HanIR_Chr02g0089561 [Helianthus annuus]
MVIRTEEPDSGHKNKQTDPKRCGHNPDDCTRRLLRLNPFHLGFHNSPTRFVNNPAIESFISSERRQMRAQNAIPDEGTGPVS